MSHGLLCASPGSIKFGRKHTNGTRAVPAWFCHTFMATHASACRERNGSPDRVTLLVVEPTGQENTYSWIGLPFPNVEAQCPAEDSPREAFLAFNALHALPICRQGRICAACDPSCWWITATMVRPLALKKSWLLQDVLSVLLVLSVGCSAVPQMLFPIIFIVVAVYPHTS